MTSEHNCKIIHDGEVAGRPWGVFCDACKKIIAACQSEAEAKQCLEAHLFWQEAKAKFEVNR